MKMCRRCLAEYSGPECPDCVGLPSEEEVAKLAQGKTVKKPKMK